VSEVDPDEDFTEGPSVAFDVAPPPQPKKPFPWWIVILVGAVVLLIVIGVVVWLLLRDSGPKSVAVPSVIGMPARAANSTLTNAGFTVKTRSVPVSDPTENGVVQSQDPAAGTAQPSGSTVTITVGHMSLVPSVKGLAEAKAKTVLADADLKVAVRSVGVADPAQDGIVQDQEPAAGTLQPPGAVVTIAVGRNVAVPDVRGRPEEDAVAVLDNAGLRAPVIRIRVSSPGQDGIVLSQTPAPGTRVPLGSSVTLRVGLFIDIR
jgi:beta-lactam-binding protein with PASTA domain